MRRARLRTLLLFLSPMVALAQGKDDPTALLTEAKKKLSDGETGAHRAEKYAHDAIQLWDTSATARGVGYADACTILALFAIGRERDNPGAQLAVVLPLVGTAVSIYEQQPFLADKNYVELAYDIQARILSASPDRQDDGRMASAKAETLRDQAVANMQPAPSTTDPTKPKPPELHLSKGDVTAPRIRVRTEPKYSDAARIARIAGHVLARIVVGTTGDVRSCHVIKGVGFGLDEQACQTVLDWKFEPGLKDGVAVPVMAKVEINFHLH